MLYPPEGMVNFPNRESLGFWVCLVCLFVLRCSCSVLYLKGKGYLVMHFYDWQDKNHSDIIVSTLEQE